MDKKISTAYNMAVLILFVKYIHSQTIPHLMHEPCSGLPRNAQLPAILGFIYFLLRFMSYIKAFSFAIDFCGPIVYTDCASKYSV